MSKLLQSHQIGPILVITHILNISSNHCRLFPVDISIDASLLSDYINNERYYI